jgi:enterochelin esterase family protein
MKDPMLNSSIGKIVAMWALFSTASLPAAESPVAATNASPARTTDNVEFTIGPVYVNAPELTVKDGVPKGTVREFVMNSEDSKVYPGIAKNQTGTVPYKRKVCVYVPQQYVAGTPSPFVVVQDGMGYTNSMVKVLDNLIYEHSVPSMIAIMINSGGGDAQGSERGLEYDTVSDKYTTFIETELLPRIEKDYNVKFTTDPKDARRWAAVRARRARSRWRGFVPTFIGGC